MARKKKGAHGGHGWFVTFADLMALLMAFFVMLAAYSTQNKDKMQAVAGSMRDAFGTQKSNRFAGIVESDGIPTRPHLKNVRIATPEDGADFTTPNNFKRKEEGLHITAFDRGFALAATSLRQALSDLPEVAEMSKNVIVEETKDGLNLSLVDQDGRSMFPDGATAPFERTRRLIEKLGPILRKMPNRLAISGHTSASRPGTRTGWSGWDLSVGRASNVREILASSGVPDDRFSSITGKADTEPMFPDNPYLAANRRVTITLMREAHPLPFNAKP
jgi:chemotaxis protein MotB